MLPCVFVFVLYSGFVGLCYQSVSLRSVSVHAVSPLVFVLCSGFVGLCCQSESSFRVLALSAYAVSPLILIKCVCQSVRCLALSAFML